MAPLASAVVASCVLLLSGLQLKSSHAFSSNDAILKKSAAWKQKGQPTAATNQQQLLQLGSSLTDDGDFALVGLNTDVTPPNLVDITKIKETPAKSFSWPVTSSVKLEDVEETNAESPLSATSSSASVAPLSGLKYNQDLVASSSNPSSSTTDRNSQQQYSAALGGLTEDGDFILEGVNAMDPFAGQALEKYGSPLLLLSGGDEHEVSWSSSNLLSQLSLGQSTTESATGSKTIIDQQILGLTDDGDLALIGFNVADSSDDGEASIGNDVLSNTQDDCGNSVTTATTTTVSMAGNERVDNDDQEIQEMADWLFECIPTLKDDDYFYYADQLVSLGLNPNCITQCELRMEDLAFMKPLHQRYLFNEVTANPHPWQP